MLGHCLSSIKQLDEKLAELSTTGKLEEEQKYINSFGGTLMINDQRMTQVHLVELATRFYRKIPEYPPVNLPLYRD